MNYVEFEDGHREEIIRYTDYPDGLKFRTMHGEYIYRTWVEGLESGFQYMNWCFLNVATGELVPDICSVVINIP